MKIERKKYIQTQRAKLDQYVKDINSQKIVSSETIKLAVKRYQRDLEDSRYYFDEDEFEVLFFFCSFTKIEVGNEYVTFEPEPWQVFYLANIYCLKRVDNDEKKYSTSFLSIARKNGKTTLGAIQALYNFLNLDYKDSQNYFVSGSRDMANVALSIVKNITVNSPSLKKRIRTLQFYLRYKEGKSTNILKVLPADIDKLNGLKPQFALVDETHVMEDSQLINLLKSGQGSLKNNLLSIISTRGFNVTYFQYEYENYCKKILRQEIENENTFIMIYEFDSEQEIFDSSKWIKTNPNLANPDILRLSKLEEMYEDARYSITSLKTFIVLNLNYWYEKNESNFIDSTQVNIVDINEDDFKGLDCFVGVDLSSTKDITSVSLLFPPQADKENYTLINYNFKTNAIDKRVRKGGKDLTEYIEQGYLVEFKSETIDYDYLYDFFDKLDKKFNIISVGYDQYNSALLIPRLENDMLLTTLNIPQTAKHLNEAMKYFEHTLINKQLDLNNPVTKWMIQNTVVYQDGNGNIKPMKNKSKDSIDSVIAICNAFANYLNEQAQDELKL